MKPTSQKPKFDDVLRHMLATPPTPKAAKPPPKPKPNKTTKPA